MYGHTYVNYWTGGPFNLASDNAPKHLLIESYIAKRTPRPGSGFLPASLSGIQRRLYDLMTFAEEGRVLATMAGMVGALSGVLLVTLLTRRAVREIEFLEDSLTMDH